MIGIDPFSAGVVVAVFDEFGLESSADTVSGFVDDDFVAEVSEKLGGSEAG